MNLKISTIKLAATLGLCLFAIAPAMAREMVSIKGDIVNMRSGASTKAQVLWQLGEGYPLQVLKRRGRWLQVRDFENDRGWVARSLTSKTPHHIVKVKRANIRQGPGRHYSVIGHAVRFDLLQTLQKKTGWIHVKQEDGQKGWVAKELLWGW